MSSRFKEILDARNRSAEPPGEPVVVELAPSDPGSTPPDAEVAPPSPAPTTPVRSEPKASRAAKAPASLKRPGRPAGKRSDDEYSQVTAYIRKDTHLSVKLALLKDQKGQEFSELVQDLLGKWLRSRS